MTVLITMAGLGSRFKERGYIGPKFRIMARGRTLMDWSLLSLQAFFEQRFVFACLEEEDEDWICSTAATLGIADVRISKRSSVSRGQAETAFDALSSVELRQPLWIYNIDTCVTSYAMRPQDLGTASGCLPVFSCSETSMSFVRYGPENDVVEVAEKRAISSWATVGLYGFCTAASFVENYVATYDCGGRQVSVGERYVAPVFDSVLRRGERVVAPRLESFDVNILGTPDQILAFDPAAQPPFGNMKLDES